MVVVQELWNGVSWHPTAHLRGLLSHVSKVSTMCVENVAIQVVTINKKEHNYIVNFYCFYIGIKLDPEVASYLS
jgi:hypothetical protein